jgi:RNA polymerase-associated protein RTF1
MFGLRFSHAHASIDVEKEFEVDESMYGRRSRRTRGAQNDISMMLARKNQLQVSNREGLTMLERSRLMQERTLALRRQDYAEVAEIDLKLEEASEASSPPVKQRESAHQN